MIRTKKVSVWNPTVANLTLMALGSSAPEILLSVIETVTSLGQCPGELGPSTIVGSAAFNLLVISGVSVYAVSPETDTGDRDETMEPGVKKINDMGVFSITSFFSIFAYLWLFYVLYDQIVEIWEAWLTLIFFFILVGLAFGADKYNSSKNESLLEKKEADETQNHIEFTAAQIFRELIKEKKGEADPETEGDREKMKSFLKETLKTDNIGTLKLEDVKAVTGEGEHLISRVKHRRAVGNFMAGKKPVIAKGEVFKAELAHADLLDDAKKNEDFGFKCLHYSVSESSDTLTVHILNKKSGPGQVRVMTKDLEAEAGKDFDPVDEIINFSKGDTSKSIAVKIYDDDNWEPDEDFLIQLVDTETGERLPGVDTETRVTIIDDDKPGQIAFEETNVIKALATQSHCKINIIRKNGSDGDVQVEYQTEQVQGDGMAVAGQDYVSEKGTLVFGHGETIKTINIEIIQKPGEERNESFKLKLSNVTPEGAKLSKKDFNLVNITTDEAALKKAEAYAQLLKKVMDEEEISYQSQFIKAAMLHPTKNEDGDIENISPLDGFLHLVTIGWKLFFALIPPPHWAGGWACFCIALGFIGIVTAVVGEFANLFGCVLGIEPAVTAITFVALGTSLPDTFASMAAAQAEKYADSAVGNVTGSNSVNVFLGLGLPWVIASMWESGNMDNDTGVYFVPAASLGFTVIVFVIVAIICLISLVIRRFVVGGELGGSKFGRYGSMGFFCTLWFIYIVMSTLQVYNYNGLKDSSTMVSSTGL